MLSDGFQSYTWNAAGQLITVTGNVVSGYRYNGDGNRVSSEVDGTTTRYLVDVQNSAAAEFCQGKKPLGTIDCICSPLPGCVQAQLEVRAGGFFPVPQVLVEKTAGESTRYLYGLDLLGQIQGGTPVYLGYDALSVRLHVNNSGEIEATYRYGPFGETVGEGVSGYGFSGEQFDAYSGLLYLRARYYAPAVGRFVSRDMFPGSIGLPSSLHQFSYVGNDPVNYVDPTGFLRQSVRRKLSKLEPDLKAAAAMYNVPWYTAASDYSFAIFMGAIIAEEQGGSYLRVLDSIINQAFEMEGFEGEALLAQAFSNPTYDDVATFIGTITVGPTVGFFKSLESKFEHIP